MKKLYFSIFILLTTVTVFMEGKKYPNLSRLNNKTSRKCEDITPAIFVRGELECQCDNLEKKLQKIADGNGRIKPVVSSGWLRGIQELLTADGADKDNRAALRRILDGESDETKWQEYEQLNSLAYRTLQESDKAQEEAKKREAEEKEKAKKRF